MKLALVKDVTPKDDIAEDEESPQALAKATRKSCKSYCILDAKLSIGDSLYLVNDTLVTNMVQLAV